MLQALPFCSVHGLVGAEVNIYLVQVYCCGSALSSCTQAALTQERPARAARQPLLQPGASCDWRLHSRTISFAASPTDFIVIAENLPPLQLHPFLFLLVFVFVLMVLNKFPFVQIGFWRERWSFSRHSCAWNAEITSKLLPRIKKKLVDEKASRI